MPNQVLAFECVICRRVFTGENSVEKATACEKLGQPKFTFPVGKRFYKKLWEGRNRLLRISSRIIWFDPNLKGHFVLYKTMEVATGEELPGWYSEERIKEIMEESHRNK
jgi:hypothetical protein